MQNEAAASEVHGVKMKGKKENYTTKESGNDIHEIRLQIIQL
jgi:hypothetical protein